MPDENPPSQEPQAPAESAPSSELAPSSEPAPSWPDVSKPETRGGNQDDYGFKTRGS